MLCGAILKHDFMFFFFDAKRNKDQEKQRRARRHVEIELLNIGCL